MFLYVIKKYLFLVVSKKVNPFYVYIQKAVLERVKIRLIMRFQLKLRQGFSRKEEIFKMLLFER